MPALLTKKLFRLFRGPCSWPWQPQARALLSAQRSDQVFAAARRDLKARFMRETRSLLTARVPPHISVLDPRSAYSLAGVDARFYCRSQQNHGRQLKSWTMPGLHPFCGQNVKAHLLAGTEGTSSTHSLGPHFGPCCLPSHPFAEATLHSSQDHACRGAVDVAEQQGPRLQKSSVACNQ